MLIDSKKVTTEGGELTLHYSLCEALDPQSYGIEICAECAESGESESAAFCDISTERGRVLKLCEKFAEELVTPTSLCYLLEDLL